MEISRRLNLAEKIAFLKTTSLFSSISEEMLARIAMFAEEVLYPANSFIYHEGDSGDFLYLIISGEVNVIRGGIFLKTRQGGDCVGEMALLDDRPRSASIMAATDLQALRLNREHFDQILTESRISRELFKVLSYRLREDLDLQTEAIRQEAARSRDLKLAAEVQRSLLPREEIRLPHIQTAGHCEPANTVGGDYYDYLIVSPEQVGVVLGDVMGHGFPSALFVAMVKSCLHNQIRQASSVPKVMKSVYHAIEQASPTGIFITMCYVLIDFRSHVFTYANAGHPPPYHYRCKSGRLEELEPTCMPLGLISGIEMPRRFSQRRPWEKGDRLLMYSDGITEAENPNEELFGEDRLQKIFLTNVGRSAEEIKATTLSELAAYCQGKPQIDDVTLVVIKL